MTEDPEQLQREYKEYCSYNVNPRSYQGWLSDKRRREAYEERQERVRQHSPDEDAWNR